MNAIQPPSQFRIRQTSVSEIRALIEAGLMDEKDPYELIDGVLYEMPSEGFDHVDIKSLIAEDLIRNENLRTYRTIVDSTLYLDEFNAPEPDLYVFPREIALRDLKPEDVSLVIEVANSSLRKDMELKAPLYARFGIQEYWIVDLESSTLLVFRPDGDGTYGEPETFAANLVVECQSVPDLKLRLADLRP